MKQVWQLIDWTWIPNNDQRCENKTRMITNKSIDTIECETYLSHKLSAIIKDKVSAQIQNNREQNKSIMYDHRINQSIIKSHMSSSHQNSFYFAWINIMNSIILELWKIHSLFIKIKRSRRLFENQNGIKTIWEKIGFLKFIWKIGVSKITWKKLEF